MNCESLKTALVLGWGADDPRGRHQLWDCHERPATLPEPQVGQNSIVIVLKCIKKPYKKSLHKLLPIVINRTLLHTSFCVSSNQVALYCSGRGSPTQKQKLQTNQGTGIDPQTWVKRHRDINAKLVKLFLIMLFEIYTMWPCEMKTPEFWIVFRIPLQIWIKHYKFSTSF